MTARLLASYLRCYGSCRSRRKYAPCSPIVMAAPALACAHPLGVVDGSCFSLYDGEACRRRPIADTTPFECYNCDHSAAFDLTGQGKTGFYFVEYCFYEQRVAAPTFCRYNRTDRACARHPRIEAQVRALVRQNGHTARWGLPLAQALVRETAQTAQQWGCPRGQVHPQEW